MDTEKIIGNLLRMGDPTLPIVNIPVKEMFGKCAYIPHLLKFFLFLCIMEFLDCLYA